MTADRSLRLCRRRGVNLLRLVGAVAGVLGISTGLTGCNNTDAIVLSVRPPAGVVLKQYAVQVQDRESRTIIYTSGVQPVDAVAKGRDLAALPLRIGLKLSRSGQYLIHVRANATGQLAPDGVTPKTRTNEYFFATLTRIGGTTEVDAPLLEVDAMYDRDFDHFPDAVLWRDATPEAKARYTGQEEVLDCIDRDPTPEEPPLPVQAFARDINPLAKPKCGLAFDVACGPVPPACGDSDKDGDPEGTDCDDNDPSRFHGNPRPRNCCECTDRVSCATNHAKRADLSVCQPPRCDSQTDYDCTGVSVACFVDEDCDGFAANDPVPSQRDCDDTNAAVYPGAPKHCDDPSKDWACDGNPRGGCVPCDLDGDGYQRADTTMGCPDKDDSHPGKTDCNDNDRGVFPGSTSYDSATLVIHDLAGQEGGGSVAAALRGLCRNKAPDGTTNQNADCDAANNARQGCPTAACDTDGDGFPKDTPACNATGYPPDCDDNDPQRFPGAPDICGDGIAQNCSSDRPCMIDSDKDGYNSDVDCDDNSAAVHPFAKEACNGRDDDCDGLIDELNPDANGNPLVGTTTDSSNKTHTGILSCTDNDRGQCGDKVTATGAYTGRCVCSGVVPISGQRDGTIPRHACPGTTDSATTAPKCFGTKQPGRQTCVAGTDTDEDCDGRIDAPKGENLSEFGSACGVTQGQCAAGKVSGCDKTSGYINPFSAMKGFNVKPTFDEKRRFLVCDNTAVGPSADVCDGKDNDCNMVVDDCQLAAPGGRPACCGGLPMCLDLNTDMDHCGDCNTICDPTNSNNCAAGTCKCGTNARCAGATPLCRTADTKCVQCLDDAGCVGITGKPHCLNQDTCVECTEDAQCGGGKKCHPTLHACVECVNDGNCATGQCDTTTNKCIACITDTYCAGKNAAAPVCKNAVPKCVECTNATHCTVATRRVCDTNADMCVECLANANCTFDATKPACDTALKVCVPCVANADCKDSTKPVCDVNKCVACAANADCKDSTKPICDANKCVECAANADCKDAAKPVCSANKCVACAANADCLDAAKPVCDANMCVECTANADCKDAAKPVCSANKCVECTANADCKDAAKPQCDTTAKACVACVNDMACAAPTPRCKTSVHMCVECLANADCSGEAVKTKCFTADNLCVECRNDMDCPAMNPVCDPMAHTCGPV